MASFPTLHSGEVTMLGFTRTASYGTAVKAFEDGSEQRWRARKPIAQFTLRYKDIDGVDLSALRAFFLSTKGGFDATWDITIQGVTYAGCAFATDTFSFAEEKPNRASGTLPIIQYP